MPTERRRILILTADAGFGHRSAANAIADALRELAGDRVQVDVVNALEHPRVPRLLRDSQTDYDRLVKQAPELYQLGYLATDQPIASLIFESAIILMLYEALRDMLNAYDPEAIVNTWPLYQAPLSALFRLNGRSAALITVVTDLVSVHRVWFNNASDRLVVPTQEAYDLAVKSGVREDKIRLIGIPVNPALSKDEGPKDALRTRLGWRPNLTTILAIGSARVPKLGEMLRGLNHSGLPIQLVISAGGDDDLDRELRATEWHVPAHLYRFVDKMPTFMHAADAIICKAGGLITTESLACGLPMILIEVLPGQEEGNARYVVAGGAGVVAESPLDVLEHVCHWLQAEGKELVAFAARARQLGKPRAAYDVAQMALTAAEVSVRWREEGLPDPNTMSPQELRAMLKRFGVSSRTRATTGSRYE
ncbi:MAG: glycosyltransferase [Anaerolineae bacterium]|nr:hypothetical protein [Candidatus Roseilinea sp.]MDW8451643.1 glycosyltransferase [Anaerolineae bacterium]